jgi:hypothetical protein
MNSRQMSAINFILLGIFSVVLLAQESAPRPATPPASTDLRPSDVPPNSPSSPTSPGAAIFKPVFQLLDSDNDGWVSRKEVESVPDLARDFDRYDLNRDGRLNRGEFDRYAAKK